MVYVVFHRGPRTRRYPSIPRATIITRGFACTPYELEQELATYCRVRKADIVDVHYYDSIEAAETIAKHHNTLPR